MQQELTKYGGKEQSQLASLLLDSQTKSKFVEYVQKPYDIPTPKEKIKKRPDGYDYIPGSYLDFLTKQNIPLYRYSLLHYSEALGWIDIIVSLEDRITGNIELGAGSARIQVRRDAEAPSFRDIIDKSNNIKAALTEAIKNAQSRFGFGADVYRRRESVPTEDERERFSKIHSELKKLNIMYSQRFEEQWNQLGTDWTDFLNQWQEFVNAKSSSAS